MIAWITPRPSSRGASQRGGARKSLRKCRQPDRRPFRIWWGAHNCTGEEFTGRLRSIVDYQINLRGGLLQPSNGPHWRKLERDYQDQLASDARAIRDHYQRRTMLHWLGTRELRRRYAPLMSV